MSFQLLLLTKIMCVYICATVMFKKNKRIRKNISCSRKPHGWSYFFCTDITFENFPENHVRKQIKPTKDHHELFFFVKSPTDNPCIESEARRNNKDLCISKSLILTWYLYTDPGTCLTAYLSARCQSGCENMTKLRILSSLAYFLQSFFYHKKRVY